MKSTALKPFDGQNPAGLPAPILKRLRQLALVTAPLTVLLGGLGIWQGARCDERSTAATIVRPQDSAGGVHVADYCESQKAAQAQGENPIQLCQVMLSPADPNPIPGVDCTRDGGAECYQGWRMMGPVMGFQEYAQGEYVGRARFPHVPTYRLRVDDVLDFVFRVTRNEIPSAYQLNVGDEVSVESATDKDVKRTLIILPDGTITLPLLGQVRAAGLTVQELREELDRLASKYYKVPAITVTPIKVDTKLEDLRYTVGGRSGFGGQVRSGRVTPEGTIQLPAVGSVPAQGLTLDEFKLELEERFAEKIEGIEVMPVLTIRAPRYVYVLGEVKTPGRYSLDAPTTLMQALAMAGSWNNGANIKQIVVFRRAEDWRLIATMVDIRAALLGRRPCPPGEIWISDADLVIVPKNAILRTDNFIELLFTKGIYGIFPFSGAVSYTNLSTLTH